MKVVSFAGTAINDVTNYEAYFIDGDYGLPASPARQIARHGRWPITGTILRPGTRKTLRIFINGASEATLREQLMRLFDPEDETPKALVVTLEKTGESAQVLCTCDAFQHDTLGRGRIFVATLAVSGDVRWRHVTAEAPATWSITATAQTHAYTNNGQDDAYPVIQITPTSAKTGSWAYKRWIPIRWRLNAAYLDYPVDITNDSFDTAALVTGGKMQADGDDLRVIVDGVEVDRWLDGINTTTTKVWVNLDFSPRQESTLNGGIDASQTTLKVDGSISGFPSAGILYIDSEAIVYTSKNDQTRTFLGCTRAAKGTTAATHADAALVYWVQHDIWIIYGNSAAVAPTVDGNYEPAFVLSSSTNVIWVYQVFGSTSISRPGAWLQLAFTPQLADLYTGNHGANVTPWTEAGIRHVFPAQGGSASGKWRFRNPCGIDGFDLDTNVDRYYDVNGISWDARMIEYDGSSIYDTIQTFQVPGGTESWTAIADDGAKTCQAGVHTLDFYFASAASEAGESLCELDGITITLESGNVPTTVIGAEQTNYSLSCRITNNTTGDAIDVDFVMALNETLEIDTDEKTVAYLEDGSSQIQALALVGGPRRDWLRLAPGSNTLKFDETGVAGLSIDITYRDRYYG